MFKKNENVPENDKLQEGFEGMDRYITAPADLKAAAKSGLSLHRAGVSRRVHIRRFSKAIAVYAVCALLLVGIAFTLPLFMAVLGMLLPGSAQVKIFGGIVITIVAAAGGSPLLAAAMLPCICGAMHGVTPPYCACVYTAMGIANSETKPTLLNCAVWIGIHYLLSAAMILFGHYLLFGLV